MKVSKEDLKLIHELLLERDRMKAEYDALRERLEAVREGIRNLSGPKLAEKFECSPATIMRLEWSYLGQPRKQPRRPPSRPATSQRQRGPQQPS